MIPKKYGFGKKELCFWCNNDATSYNTQKIPICRLHKFKILTNIKCACGQILDEINNGKYGPYMTCINCGNLNLNKIKEMVEPITTSYKINGALKHI
jgi:hypothetical protein